MKRRFLLALILLITLPACVTPAAEPTLLSSLTGTPTATQMPTTTQTPTPTFTPSPTAIPSPVGLTSLPDGLTVVRNADGIWGIGIDQGENTVAIPNLSVDSKGIHVTLDSGRVIDAQPADLEKSWKYDSEYNFLKVYDADGKISAEYDPGVGKVDSPDYIPATGWVDIQKLAKDLVCSEGKTCINGIVGAPANSAWLEFSSTGIFRKINLFDKQGGKVIGNMLLLQFVSRDVNQNAITGWTLVSSEDLASPGSQQIGVIDFVTMDEKPQPSGYYKIYPVDQWEKWMPKGKRFEFGFPKNWDYYNGAIWDKSTLVNSGIKTDARRFWANGGVGQYDNLIIISNSSS